jgi:hypothetical protein
MASRELTVIKSSSDERVFCCEAVRPPAVLLSHVSLAAVSLESVFTTVAVMTHDLPVTFVT